MRNGPIIKDFKVPEYVFVDMQNDDDYVKVPLSNLDEKEINLLLYNFEKSVREISGVPYPPTQG